MFSCSSRREENNKTYLLFTHFHRHRETLFITQNLSNWVQRVKEGRLESRRDYQRVKEGRLEREGTTRGLKKVG